MVSNRNGAAQRGAASSVLQGGSQSQRLRYRLRLAVVRIVRLTGLRLMKLSRNYTGTFGNATSLIQVTPRLSICRAPPASAATVRAS